VKVGKTCGYIFYEVLSDSIDLVFSIISWWYSFE